MLKNVEWGKFTFKSIFNRIAQGRRLKKEDQLPGNIPFVMAGVTNTGVVNYVSNPVATFPKNSITVDIFGNVFYRDYDFGAGDDTGVYWNSERLYSKETMLFFTIAMKKALQGKYSYGKKLRSSQSFNFQMYLPIKDNEIYFDFMDRFIAELEAQRITELETQRATELKAYLTVTGLQDYVLTDKEQQALEEFENLKFEEFNSTDIFEINNTQNILSRDIVENSGETPYLCASAENNSVSSYIAYDEKFIDQGNCIFIGGKTFVISYQEKDFFSNDSHNLCLYLKESDYKDKLTQLYIATCVYKSLKHKYSWGDSISKAKINKDVILLPVKNGKPNYSIMRIFISAIQKLVIKEVVEYADREIAATKKVVGR